MTKLRISQETQLLMTEEQKKELPRLVSRLEVEWSRGRVYEGVKYVLHLSFAEEMTTKLCDELMAEMGAKAYFAGKIFSKPETVFFFMPLFD